jgi:hypothetical protein
MTDVEKVGAVGHFVEHKQRLKMERCRHERNSWIVAGGRGEWCYVCGSYRGLELVGENIAKPRTAWIRPTGDRDDNPADKLKSRS